MLLEKRLKLLRLQTLEPLALSVLSQRFEESGEQPLVSADGHLGNVPLRAAMLEVTVQKPMVGFSNAFGFWEHRYFSDGQISKQMFERGERLEPGQKPCVGRWGEGEKSFEKWFRHGLREFGTGADALFDEKGIELTASAQEPLAVSDGVAALLKVIGEPIKMGAQWSPAEIQDRTFFFVPIFEHSACKKLEEEEPFSFYPKRGEAPGMPCDFRMGAPSWDFDPNYYVQPLGHMFP